MRRIILSATLILGLHSSYALAEEKTATFELEEIVVTATRVEEKVMDVPANVSILTKEEIKSSQAKNVPDLLKNSTGIYVYDTSGVGSAGRINMRGFWGGMSNHTLVLIDGIPANSGKNKLVDWNGIPMNNIERIEVVRGGNSALYGDNAFAGVINIITRISPETFQTTASISGGSFDTKEYKLGAGGVRNNLDYLINASKKETEGYRKHGDYRNFHLDGKLGIKVDEDSRLTFSTGYHKTNRGALSWALTEKQINVDRRRAKPGTEKDEGENERTNMSITYKQPYFSVIGQIRKEEGDSFSSLVTTKEYLDDETTGGLNIQSEFSHSINSFVAGCELEQNKVKCKEYAAPSYRRGTLKNDQSVTRKKYGIWLEDRIKLSVVDIIPAIRYDRTTYDVANNKTSKTNELNLSALSPKLGAVYSYNENLNLYLNAGKSFRSPTMSQLFTYERANPELKPEEGRSIEAGVKYQPGEFITGNLSIYQMKVDGEIYYDYAERGYKNKAKTSHEGIELELKAKATKDITVGFNYTCLEAKNETGTYSGYYLSNIPRYETSLNIKYQNKEFDAKLIANHTGSSYMNDANTKKLSDYTIIDGGASYRLKENYTIFLNVDNIFDKEYYCYGFVGSRGNSYNPAPGRTIKAGVECSF